MKGSDKVVVAVISQESLRARSVLHYKWVIETMYLFSVYLKSVYLQHPSGRCQTVLPQLGGSPCGESRTVGGSSRREQKILLLHRIHLRRSPGWGSRRSGGLNLVRQNEQNCGSFHWKFIQSLRLALFFQSGRNLHRMACCVRNPPRDKTALVDSFILFDAFGANKNGGEQKTR